MAIRETFSVKKEANADTAIWVMMTRNRHNMSINVFAENFDLAPQTVAAWELGMARPTQYDLRAKLEVAGNAVGMPPLPTGARIGRHLDAWNIPHFPSDLEDHFNRLFPTTPAETPADASVTPGYVTRP